MRLNCKLLIALPLIFFTLATPLVSFASEQIKDLGLDFSTGYRVDQFDWSIAGNTNGTNPNILSELTWADMEIFQLQLDGWVESKDLLWLKTNTLFLGKMAYGKIYVGENRDSDYAGDNRTLEWSRSVNQSDDGFTFDVSGAFGPKYELLDGRVSLAPLLGYSFHIQHFIMTDGKQTVSDDAIHDAFFDPLEDPWPLGQIPALDSSYTAYWYGPWFGLNLQLKPVEKWTLELSGEYHIVEYFAEANWNLRANLVHPISFEHDACGTGLIFTLKSSYELTEHWSAVFTGNLQSWQTDDGTDTTYFVGGTRGGTRLNEVNWESYALMIGLGYRF